MRRPFMLIFLVVTILLMPFLTGCWGGTPDAVIAGVTAEGELLKQVQDYYVEALDIQFANTDEALNAHIETILDYEIRLQAAGDVIAVEKLQNLLAAYRQKRADIKAQLALIKKQMQAADVTMETIRRLHEKTVMYLTREQVSISDFTGLLSDINSAMKGVGDGK